MLRSVATRYNLDLTRYLIDGDDFGNAIGAFVTAQWKARRCALFHAKASEEVLLPRVLEDARFVRTALVPLSRFLVELVEKLYGIRRAGGALTPVGFRQVVTVLAANGYQIGLVDDPSPEAEKSKADYESLEVTEPPMFWEQQAISTEFDCAFIARLQEGSRAPTSNTIISFERSDRISNHLIRPAASGLRSRHTLPRIDPKGAKHLQATVRWFLNNLGVPRSVFSD